MSKELEQKIYSMSNSFLPLDMFYNDIRDNKAENYNKEQAYKDLEIIADFILDLQSQLDQANERLKGAIVPKFKIGQECYLIDNNFNYFKNTKEFNIVCSNIKKQQSWYYVKDYGVYHENDLFVTEQEAQTKLQELRGGE